VLVSSIDPSVIKTAWRKPRFQNRASDVASRAVDKDHCHGQLHWLKNVLKRQEKEKRKKG
jgi:hypothetical protein